MTVDLPGLLRGEGLTVSVDSGWQSYVRPGDWAPCGVVMHHTGGHNDLDTVRNGRPDLKGPLANLYLARTGLVTLISGGRTNHAGAGAQTVLDETRRDIAPSGSAAARGLVDGPTGNGYFYGVEMECLGDNVERFTPAQMDAMPRIGAALCRHHSWTAARNIAHLEWTKRKVDPRAPGFAMGWLRSAVAARLAPQPQPPQVTPISTFGVPPMVRHQDYIDIPAPSTDDKGNGAWTLPWDFGTVGYVTVNDSDQAHAIPHVVGMTNSNGKTRVAWKGGPPNAGKMTLIVEHWGP